MAARPHQAATVSLGGSELVEGLAPPCRVRVWTPPARRIALVLALVAAPNTSQVLWCWAAAVAAASAQTRVPHTHSATWMSLSPPPHAFEKNRFNVWTIFATVAEEVAPIARDVVGSFMHAA